MAIEAWVPPHQPGETAEAEKHTGASSKILRGEQRPPFARGVMGVVTQEKITVVRNSKERDVDLVTKYFSQNEGPDDLKSALSAYKQLKEAGVRHIPPTYRKVGSNEALVTDYNRDGEVAVGGNKNEKTKELFLTSITNLPELLASVAEDLQRASAAQISVFADSYFFTVPEIGGDASVGFVIGDLGGIGQLGKYGDGQNWHDANIERAKDALLYFVSTHVVESRQASYKAQILGWAASLEKDGYQTDALASEAMDRGA